MDTYNTRRGSAPELDAWFESYVEDWLPHDDDVMPMISLKLDHSARVAGLSEAIAQELGWPVEDVSFARAIGLLHDIGRFAQFARFRTFIDTMSVDHGAYGREVLAGSPILERFSARERTILLACVEGHNRRAIPGDTDDETMPFLQLVRDADKLDIFRIIDEDIQNGRVADRLKSALDIPDSPHGSPGALADIYAESTVDNAHITNLTDYHLMQLSWVFDINYAPTWKRLHRTGTLRRIEAVLPDTPDVTAAVTFTRQYAERFAPTEP